MTTQQAYERIREYFSRPDAVIASDGENGCCYRAEGNASSPVRCAIGCLIPDSKYKPEIEGMDAGYIIDNIRGFKGPKRGFLFAAQSSHDTAVGVPEFIAALDDVARNHGLTVEA